MLKIIYRMKLKENSVLCLSNIIEQLILIS